MFYLSKHYITRNSSTGTGKAFLVKIKNKMSHTTPYHTIAHHTTPHHTIPHHKNFVNVRPFKGKGSIQNPYADQCKQIAVYI